MYRYRYYLLSWVLCLLGIHGVFEAGSTVMYVDITTVRPGQVRYSQRDVDLKVDKALSKGYFTDSSDKRVYKFDSGKSIIPDTDALPVVQGPKGVGYVLVDGHHDTLASLKVGALTIPITILSDLSKNDEATFWQLALQNNYIYPYTLAGIKEIPLQRIWGTLEDDALRYFAKLISRKYDPKKKTSEGADYPVWIKVDGVTPPFIEFKISDALRTGGIVYSYDMGDNAASASLAGLAEQARILLAKSSITGLNVIATKTNYKDIDFKQFDTK